jgi:hypothetical protein
MEVSQRTSFEVELRTLLNRYDLEKGSDTPDFLLANYLVQCLAVFDATIAAREDWYHRPLNSVSSPPKEPSP